MKRIFKITLAVLFLSPGLMIQSWRNSDDNGPRKKLPAVVIKDLAGNALNTSDIENGGKPIVLSFWATWCKPCKLELNTIAEEYEDWQDETGVKLIAVSIDDERTKAMVEPIVNAAGWDYEIWMDTNADLKRAMGVNAVPHTFLLNGQGEIVYAHNNFALGDEVELYEQIMRVTEE